MTKPGDYRPTLHDCAGLRPGSTVRHDVPVLITSVERVTGGIRYRGVRCDGTRIEWVEER